jgi:hypothetical protein
MFAFSAFVASSAFAAEEMEYLVSGEAVTTATNVTMTGKLVLEDMGSGAIAVECEGNGKGTVNSGGKASQTEATATGCKTVKGTCGSPNAKAVGLPWASTIDLSEGEPRSLFTGGYTVTCFGIIKDECSGETSAKIENMSLETPPDLLLIFDAKTQPGNCSVGGVGQGLVTGEILISAEGGLSLAIS